MARKKAVSKSKDTRRRYTDEFKEEAVQMLLDSRYRLVKAVPIVCMARVIISSLSVYPHSLCYFNELSGGSINGWKHLDYSNID